jgi:hypothetical protein
MNSPYLASPDRLADVIAAIQAMAIYKFYKLNFQGWADRLSADQSRAQHWEKVFVDHPEFFRLDRERKRASLVWRRQYPKRFNVDTFKEISNEDYDNLTEEQKKRISRSPLAPTEISKLIDAAVNMHARALEAKKDRQWYKPFIIQALAAFLGAVLGAWATIQSKSNAPQQPPIVLVSPQPPITPK